MIWAREGKVWRGTGGHPQPLGCAAGGGWHSSVMWCCQQTLAKPAKTAPQHLREPAETLPELGSHPHTRTRPWPLFLWRLELCCVCLPWLWIEFDWKAKDFQNLRILSSARARGSTNPFFFFAFPLTPGVKGRSLSNIFYFCKRLAHTSSLRFGNPTLLLLLLLMESFGMFCLEPNPSCCLHFIIFFSVASFLSFLP